MAKAQIDLTGLSGLAPRFYGDLNSSSSSPNLRYIGNEGQLASGIYNPVISLGYMSPANATTKAVTGTTSFLLTSALVVPSRIAINNTDAIFFADEATTGTTGKIVNLDTGVDTSLDERYAIPVFGSPDQYSKSEDMIMYSVNTSRKIYFTRTNTTTSGFVNCIGIADSDFGNADEDWSSGVPTGASTTLLRSEGRLVFVLADNGLLYVLNGRAIHKIDGTETGGTNGTVTEDAMLFLTNTRLIDGVDLRGRMWIGMHILTGYDISSIVSTDVYSDFVGIYVWDRRTTVATMQDFIPVVGAKALTSMHVFKGNAACFTISTEGYSQFRVWNGSEMKVIQTLGKNAHPQYRRHSFYNGDNYVIWFGGDGKIYLYGSIDGSQDALHIIGDMTAHVSNGQTYSQSGVLVAANETETVTSGNNPSTLAFYLSFSDSGGNHLKKWYPFATDSVASNNQLAHQGDIYTLVKYLPEMSTVKHVDIRCAPATSSSSTIATIKYYFNQSSTASITKTITGAQASRGYIRHEINKPYINSIQIEIEHATATVLGNAAFRPSVALVEYEPTNTKG